MAAPTAERIYDDGVVAPYAPNLYHYDHIATAGLNGFDAIDDQAIARFDQQGYLVVHNAFTSEEVKGGLDGLLHLISGEVADFNGVMYSCSRPGVCGSLEP